MIKKTPIWTWILPDNQTEESSSWKENGGKWLVYGSLDEMEGLSSDLDRHIQMGDIVSAKFWNASETSAMCVYSLDRDRDRTKHALMGLGFRPTAWEYDYARKKNWTRPRFFLSAFHKSLILVRTFGVFGALRFIIGAYAP